MTGMKCIAALGIIAGMIVSSMGGNEVRIVCYRRNLMLNPEGSGNENCTHVVFRVGSVDSKTAHVSESLTYILGKYKAKYPYLKLILNIDPHHQLPTLPQVVSSQAGRSRMIKDLVKIMKKVGYDGINLVFRHKYVYETALLASGLKKEIGGNGGIVSGYFLKNITQEDFHPMKLSEVAATLDFMAIAAFEKDKSRPYTELTAPLYSRHGDFVSRTIQWYLRMGAPGNKILMCIQSYGVSHTLDNPDSSGIGAPSKKKGWSLYNVYVDGYLTLSVIKEPEWVFYRDDISKAPYAVQYLQWASFEDETSVYDKAQYIKENKLGGAALVSYDKVDATHTELPFTKYLSEILNN